MTGPLNGLRVIDCSEGLAGPMAAMYVADFGADGIKVDPVIPHVLYGQAIWGATAAVAALVERERSGHGQTVTVGGLHGFLVTMTGGITHRPEIPAVRAPGGGRGGNPVYRLYQCADGE